MPIQCNITKHFKDFKLNLFMEKGTEHLGILGASGSGKSMTLKILAGIETADSGRIVLNDRVLYDSTLRINVPPRNRQIGYLFQNYALFPHLTVEKNIEVGMKYGKFKKDILNYYITQFKLDGLEKRYPSQLSGGQQQRVALARIMASDPKAILLDEPFSALDSYLKDSMYELLLELLSYYKGDVIMVSHNLDEIYQFCERLVVIEHGSQIMSETTKKIFEEPQNLETAKLTGCKNISPILKIDSHCMIALAWDVILWTNDTVSENITHVGIRALHIEPAYEKQPTNCMKVVLKDSTDSLFQKRFIMSRVKEECNVVKIAETKTNEDRSNQDRSTQETIEIEEYEIDKYNADTNSKNSNENLIKWYISKEDFKVKCQNKIPPYLYLPSERLILLSS